MTILLFLLSFFVQLTKKLGELLCILSNVRPFLETEYVPRGQQKGPESQSAFVAPPSRGRAAPRCPSPQSSSRSIERMIEHWKSVSVCVCLCVVFKCLSARRGRPAAIPSRYPPLLLTNMFLSSNDGWANLVFIPSVALLFFFLLLLLRASCNHTGLLINPLPRLVSVSKRNLPRGESKRPDVVFFFGRRRPT